MVSENSDNSTKVFQNSCVASRPNIHQPFFSARATYVRTVTYLRPRVLRHRRGLLFVRHPVVLLPQLLEVHLVPRRARVGAGDDLYRAIFVLRAFFGRVVCGLGGALVELSDLLWVITVVSRGNSSGAPWPGVGSDPSGRPLLQRETWGIKSTHLRCCRVLRRSLPVRPAPRHHAALRDSTLYHFLLCTWLCTRCTTLLVSSSPRRRAPSSTLSLSTGKPQHTIRTP